MLKAELDKNDKIRIGNKEAYRVIYCDGSFGPYVSSLNCIEQMMIREIKIDTKSVIIDSIVAIPIKNAIIVNSELLGTGTCEFSEVSGGKVYGKTVIKKSKIQDSNIMSSNIKESVVFNTKIEKSAIHNSGFINCNLLDVEATGYYGSFKKIRNEYLNAGD